MGSLRLSFTFSVLCLLMFQTGVMGIFEPSLVSFGDFMEYFLGVMVACLPNGVQDPKGLSSASQLFTAEFPKFDHCTRSLNTSARSVDYFDDLSTICHNKAKYLECWDNLKSSVSTKCGKDKEPLLPAVYKAVAESFCGNDNGTAYSAALRKASTEIDLKAQENCPPETGIHWFENCQPLLVDMTSENLCKRHFALYKCLEKITCPNIKLSDMMKKIYLDAGTHLHCNNGTSIKDISKNEKIMNLNEQTTNSTKH